MNNTPFNKPKQIYINPDKLETIEPKLPPLPVIAKKQTVYVSPKQETPQDVEIANIENEIAMAQTPQGGNPQFQRSPEEEELKKQTLQYLLERMPQKQVEIPQRLTIADVLNGSNFGERIGTLAQYAQQPEFQRNIGNLFGPMTYNPHTGKITSYGEELGREAEARLQADKQRAIEEESLNNRLASNIYNIMNGIDTEAMREDRFNRQLAQQAEQFAQSLGAKQEQREYDRQREDAAIQRQLEQQNFLNQMREKEFELKEKELELKENNANNGNAKNGIAQMTAADKKALTENKTTIKNIEAGLEALEKNPNAYTWLKGKMGADLANRIDPKGVKTRTQIDNITAVYRKWLTGAQMSDKERLAYERFLPAPSDNYNIVKAKLQGMKESVERSNQALLDNYGMTPQADTVDLDPMGLGL